MAGYNFLVKGKSFAIFPYGGGTYHSRPSLPKRTRSGCDDTHDAGGGCGGSIFVSGSDPLSLSHTFLPTGPTEANNVISGSFLLPQKQTHR